MYIYGKNVAKQMIEDHLKIKKAFIYKNGSCVYSLKLTSNKFAPYEKKV